MSALAHFEFHYLKTDPIVPVTVYCQPKSDNNLATLLYKKDEHKVDSRGPAPENWEIDIPYGRYDFIAEIDNRRGEKLDESILPPYREIPIEVAR